MQVPFTLMSLLDMMKLPIGRLVGALTHISDFGRVTHDRSIDHAGSDMLMPPAAYSDLLANIEDFCTACEETGLAVTLRAARSFQEIVKQIAQGDGSGVIAAIDVGLFGNHAALVTGCLFHEAETVAAITIAPERAKYFEPQGPLFGAAVHARFPDAAQDVEDAGRCLAFGQGTASVMHLMRVLEVGLKALAGELAIPYAPSWESYLAQIQKQIGAKHDSKSAKWKKSEKFFRDVSGDLMTIKQAWRNPTMHVDRKYYPDEAEVIFSAARTLMQTLAEKLPKKKKTGK